MGDISVIEIPRGITVYNYTLSLFDKGFAC